MTLRVLNITSNNPLVQSSLGLGSNNQLPDLTFLYWALLQFVCALDSDSDEDCPVCAGSHLRSACPHLRENLMPPPLMLPSRHLKISQGLRLSSQLQLDADSTSIVRCTPWDNVHHFIAVNPGYADPNHGSEKWFGQLQLSFECRIGAEWRSLCYIKWLDYADSARVSPTFAHHKWARAQMGLRRYGPPWSPEIAISHSIVDIKVIQCAEHLVASDGGYWSRMKSG